jgi:hypothetical protein
VTQPWTLSWRADPFVAAMADRHYSRETPGAQQFSPPGRVLVLRAPAASWVTSWQDPQYVDHGWPGAWVCTLFRNEGSALSSDLVRAAVAATRWTWATPAEGMVTFIDPAKVRHKRDPGRCFLRAGFRRAGMTKGGLLVLRLDPADMPAPDAPIGAQFMFEASA